MRPYKHHIRFCLQVTDKIEGALTAYTEAIFIDDFEFVDYKMYQCKKIKQKRLF